METNEQAQRERYQEVERTLVKLVEELEGIEDGEVKELEQKIYKGVLELTVRSNTDNILKLR